MRTYLYNFVGISLCAAVVLIAPLAHAATNPTSFCGHGSYGYNVIVSSSTYNKHEPVNFCIQDDTRIPLFIGTQQNPWEVVDAQGNVIYTPPSVNPTSQPPASWTYYSTWDQKDNDGHWVKPGVYSIVYTFQNNPRTSFAISKKNGKE